MRLSRRLSSAWLQKPQVNPPPSPKAITPPYNAKQYPDSPSWPTFSQWTAFNATLKGNLIKAVPAASPCYPGPSQSRTNCLAAAKLRAPDDPIQVRTAWFSGFPCPAEYDNGTGHCSLGNYSPYVVKAMSKEDVSEGVKFANEHGLRLVVKNTGHDFLGRNLGYGSLSIWTHNLRGIDFKESWTPSVGPPLGKKQSAVVFGSGIQWRELYGAAYKANKTIVGGADPDVGAGGGWALGGGHGPMANRYGLGVDNILEMEVVLPSGAIIITNSNSYPDLFWAMRGGGGSTFGIVTKMTFATHAPELQHGIRITITPGDSNSAGYTKGMAYLMTKMPEFVDFGMTGYPIMSATKYESLFTTPGKEASDIDDFISPIVDRLEKMGLTVSLIRIPSWSNVLANSLGLSPNGATGLKTGTNVMGTRLLTRGSFADVKNWERVLAIFFAEGYITEPFALMGGKVAQNKGLDVSLNPAWRNAIMHFSILDKDSDKYGSVAGIEKAYRRMQDLHVPLLDAMSADNAAYFNEASYIEPKWQHTFWGSNYPRLVGVKQKYDPNNTFWCHPCVGNEGLVLGNDRKLYRR
ncbi:FAD-binding domain-containing protein [Tothia fuscella]|uniref:FAD-binding domain-containing protein n=1 Tax=Tothia fuscella TaxID=1048955 RepID=A0A9P4NYS9_9PEZI|nr:FAD-binding domain-containing protein [Tothia fuscella]